MEKNDSDFYQGTAHMHLTNTSWYVFFFFNVFSLIGLFGNMLSKTILFESLHIGPENAG